MDGMNPSSFLAIHAIPDDEEEEEEELEPEDLPFWPIDWLSSI